MDIYQNLAPDYDLLQPKEEIFRQKPFFQKLIKDHDLHSCLDCACGTGWHLYLLHQLGLHCAGSDQSAAMLQQARHNLQDLSIPLKNADFRKLSESWSQQFDLLICMTTSFLHNRSLAQAIQTLRSMHICLKKAGILVIDNGVADTFFKARPKFLPGRIGTEQAFYFFLEYPDPRTAIFNILKVKKTATGFEHDFQTMSYLTMGQKEVEQCFAQVNFSSVRYYGQFDFSPYEPASSPRLIVIARK